MLNQIRSQKGFTLIELVMVIVILAVLGAIALPIFVNLRDDAVNAAEQGVVGGVRAGISTFFIDPARGNRFNYPATLDNAANAACTPANPCFGNVLAQGGITSEWERVSATSYNGPARANGQRARWVYTPGTATAPPNAGNFVCAQNCG